MPPAAATISADTSPSSPVLAAVALGSNLGDRAALIQAARQALAAIPGTAIVAHADPIETPPFGPVPQGPYLNAATLLRTTLSPRELLAALHAIEREHGRDRAGEVRWGPRTLDLDLLLYAEAIIDEPGLQVPHPRMHERLFVLEPLATIAPELCVPTLNANVATLLARLRG